MNFAFFIKMKKYLISKNYRIFMINKKLNNVKWLIPGWVGLEYYKLSRKSGMNKIRSLENFAKAEAIRFSALSIPLPGSYELATTTMYFLKKKIDYKDFEGIKFKTFTNEIKNQNFFKHKFGKYKLKKYLLEKKIIKNFK